MATMESERSTVGGMNWWAYVQRHVGGESNADIARRIDVTPSTLSRWARGSNPDPAQAAKLARAYDRPVLEAFVVAGFLSPEEAKQRPTAAPSLATLSDDDLLGEVRRRMQGGQQWASGTPGPEDDSDDGGVVRPFPDPRYDPDMHQPQAADELPERLKAEQRGDDEQQ